MKIILYFKALCSSKKWWWFLKNNWMRSYGFFLEFSRWNGFSYENSTLTCVWNSSHKSYMKRERNLCGHWCAPKDIGAARTLSHKDCNDTFSSPYDSSYSVSWDTISKSTPSRKNIWLYPRLYVKRWHLHFTWCDYPFRCLASIPRSTL